MAAAIIMMITYGHQVSREGDEYVRLAEAVREIGSQSTGIPVVDIFPIRKSIARYMCNISFRSQIRSCLVSWRQVQKDRIVRKRTLNTDAKRSIRQDQRTHSGLFTHAR